MMKAGRIRNTAYKTTAGVFMRMLLLCGLVTAVIFGTPAAAAETEGNWPIDLTKTDCSIELVLEYQHDGQTNYLSGGSLALYTVAGVAVDNGYVYDLSAGKFSGVSEIQDIPSMTAAELKEENADLAAILEKAAANVEADQTVAVTDGRVEFTNLTAGLYLVIQAEDSKDGIRINPFLISIPDSEGNYNIEAFPKPGYFIPEKETETETPPPKEVPQTGQLWWPVLVLGAGGILLLICGIVVRSKTKKSRA